MNEPQTQSELIEPALRAAGWEPGMYKKEWPITAESKPGVKHYKQLRVDYVLVYKNRKLAVIEAKTRDVSHRDGTAQAKDYADRRLHVRYTYATNAGRRGRAGRWEAALAVGAQVPRDGGGDNGAE